MKNYIMVDNNVYFDLLTSTLFFEKLPDLLDRQNLYNTLCAYRQQKQIELLSQQNNRKIKILNIVPTMNCDGRCLYCYNQDSNNTIGSDLTVNKIEQYIEECIQKHQMNLSDITNVRFYGGEPLLNKDIYDIIMYLHNKYKPLFHISSGMLFSEDYFNTFVLPLFKKLKENDVCFSVTTTIDFGSDPYTRNYKDISINSYHMLQNRLNVLLENEINIVYATVVNKYTNVLKLEKDLEETYVNVQKYDTFDLNTENIIRPVAFRISIANHNDFSPSKNQLKELYDMLLKLYKKYPIISNLYPYTDVVCGALIEKIDETKYSFIYPPTRCGIYTYMVEFLPTGLGNCHMNVFDNDICFSNNSLVYNELTTNAACVECTYEMVCRKGCCYRKHYANNVAEIYCDWIRYSFDLAWKRIYNMCENNPQILKNYINNHTNQMVGII